MYSAVPQANGGDVCLLTPILFCPWSGEAIMTVELLAV